LRAISLGLLLTDALPPSLPAGLPLTGVSPGVPEMGVSCSGEGSPSCDVSISRPLAVVSDSRRRCGSANAILWSGMAGLEESMMKRGIKVDF
jgi:hypothetical protein